MDLVVAFVVGGVCGWLLGRVRQEREKPATRFRPNKRQRKILASLPPDPVRPTIQDLVVEEAAAQGVDQIPGAGGVAMSVRLRVWTRDRPELEPCPDEDWRFVLAEGVTPDSATERDVRLECRPGDRNRHDSGNTTAPSDVVPDENGLL